MKRLFRSGDIFLWLTGAVLGGIVFLVAGLLLVVSLNGAGVFWPSHIVLVRLNNGQAWLGEIESEEAVPAVAPLQDARDAEATRLQLKIGNRDVYGVDFKWIPGHELTALSYPADAVCLERREYGNFYGLLLGVKDNGRLIAEGPASLQTLTNLVDKSNEVWQQRYELEKGRIGLINYRIEQLRLRLKKLEFYGEADPDEVRQIHADIGGLEREYADIGLQIDSLNALAGNASVVLALADGSTKDIPVTHIIRFYRSNTMSFLEKAAHYGVKIREFMTADPRESNTEGGVFPAIFGTVMMVLLMTLAVVPFGVVAALYLREYARQGLLVRLIRIAVNNLAGVPSIVFGIFGLGFFVYFCGGSLDRIFYPERLPNPTWGTGGILWASLTLALLTVPVVIVATEEALAAVPRGVRDGSLALGATKWQTTWRVILPACTPGILTGIILAMARGAGEVAPLMITGVVKLAPSLPLDASFPFVHLDRKFMHLGFHIYDVGFQSPNVEAAKPMVFITALLLISIVLLLNLTAIIVRARLRKKYQSSAF
jgi:phosphate transport system permease protein